MANRFDLEQQILECWTVTNDVKLVMEELIDKGADHDTIANMLIGIEYLYDAKFRKLFDSYETMAQEGKIQ